MKREGEEQGSSRALTFRARAQALNRESLLLSPRLCDAPALSSSPLQTLLSLSSCTSKGILEETDSNNLNIDPTLPGTSHQAVVAAGGEKASLISLDMEVAPQDLS